MACDITLGRLEPCKDVIGGIKNIYFMNWEQYPTIDASDIMTDISSVNGTPTTVALFKWEVKGATSLEQTVNSSRENGTTFWEQVLTCTFKKLVAADQKDIKLLSYGRPQVFVEDYNGNVLLCGRQNGMDVTGGTIVTGTAMGDLSGFTLVLTGQESTPANFITAGSDTEDSVYPFDNITTAPTITVGT